MRRCELGWRALQRDRGYVGRGTAPVLPGQGGVEDAAIASARAFDRRLVIGATIFGAGWGLVGLCPGPAIADLVLVPRNIALAMLAGMVMFRIQTIYEASCSGTEAPASRRTCS